MEQRITVMGKTYIIPSNRVSDLIYWLEANAVVNTPKQVVREVTGDNVDPRQLLTEDVH
jgi:hypothetical protein